MVSAIVIGVVLAALEGALLASSRQKLSPWVYAQSLLFWFTCGFMIGIVDASLPPYVSGALLALFLSLPWFINISIIPRQYGHLAPLVVSSIVFGALGGLLKMLLAGVV